MCRYFQVEKKIGHGQFSVVYRAKNIVDGQIVALKKIQVEQRWKEGVKEEILCYVIPAHCRSSTWWMPRLGRTALRRLTC